MYGAPVGAESVRGAYNVYLLTVNRSGSKTSLRLLTLLLRFPPPVGVADVAVNVAVNVAINVVVNVAVIVAVNVAVNVRDVKTKLSRLTICKQVKHVRTSHLICVVCVFHVVGGVTGIFTIDYIAEHIIVSSQLP